MTRSATLTAAHILKRRVIDRHGEEVGSIEDLVIEPARGMIEYIILELEDERRVSVPFNALRVETTHRGAVELGVSRATLYRSGPPAADG